MNDVDTSDILTVTEKLDNGTIRTISSAVRNQTYTINITPANLALGGHTVIITVNDGKGGTAQRTYTFQRTNSAPVISGTDTNLGQMTGAFSRSYTITDADGDKVTVTEKLDTEILRTYTASLGVAQNISVSQDRWIRMRNGSHTLKVEASDGKASTVIRTFNFSKNERIISFTLSTPFEADVRPRKILVTPSWQIEGATAKVEVCNNAFDSAPTWEDMTPQVIINRVFNFINQNKTAGKWGVNIRITITKNEGYAGEVSISSIGGAFE